MKKEDLIEQGLTEDQAKFVMAEHGKIVTTLNSQITTLQQSETELKNQVNKRDADLKKLQKDNSDNDALKQQIKDLQKENSEQEEKYQEQLISFQKSAALNALLSESKAKNPKAVTALLDDEKIIFKDGELSGVQEQIEALKESDSYLFDLGTKQGSYNPSSGQATKNYASFEEAMKENDVEGFLRQQVESEEN
ncbi:phage scaffolding protein [Enterococcus faecalis]|uniref:phage scaffolding protein n=1 Tax=Enterococcus faecalis TaxID=1351 RepID=UPI002814283B|nr:phage scaffolding protein [Enterococcus faecalis]MDR0027157.1 phage scaffolding protein [Enterococcus faecalis]